MGRTSEYRVKLLPYQKRMLKSKNPFTFAVMGRGAGKTYTLSLIALINLLKGKNLILAAQKYDALRDVLMRQVQKRVHEWGLENAVKFSMNPIRATYGDHTIYGTSYEAIESTGRGLDAISGILLDEVALAPLDVLDILGPTLRGPGVVDPFIFGATTPRSTSLWNHRFVGKLSGSEDWEIIRATTYDNWTLTKQQLDIIERSVQTKEMKRQELYADILLNGSDNCLIHEDEFPSFAAPSSDQRVIAGLDLSKGTVERDAFGWFVRRGNRVLDMKEFKGMSHEMIVKYILDFHRHTPINELNMDLAWSEYASNVLKYHMPVNTVNFNEKASEEQRGTYFNVRAEMWFNLAWYVRHGLHIGFLPETTLYDADGNLIGADVCAHLRQQLCTVTWERANDGRLKLVDKEQIRKLIGMSPDIGDAAALTCLERYRGDEPPMRARLPEAMRKQQMKYAGYMG